MFRSLALVSLLAALPLANAQSADTQPAANPDPQSETQSQPAPIVRSYPAARPGGYIANPAMPIRPHRFQNQIVESQPIAGIWLRSESSSAVKTISATPQRTEIGLERGRLNVNVHHPADHSEILVDLPGGQVSLFKDGLYTFNADTGTVRVLRGEAAAYPGPIAANTNVKPIKVKEDHQLSLITTAGARSSDVRSVEVYPYELTADLLPPSNNYDDRYGDGPDYPRNDYPYPYYAGGWDYPYAYPGFYPYGYGYPFGYGIGIGYYGGWGHGFGGYRGGFRR